MSTNDVLCTQCQTCFADDALYCSHCGHAKPRNPSDALIGQVLDSRYSILAQIGQGASGTVFRAEHVVLKRKVAIKVLHLELSRDDMALERFRREATIVAAIENEHIVQVNDIGRTNDGRLYFAMEFVEGQPLDVVLRKEQTLTIERTAEILIQVAEALMEAHGIGYVHRDIRPRNILLGQRKKYTDFIKLLDFGLAKLVDSDQQVASTTLGMTFGDPRYMSPEQARGDRIDRRSDIYQLGCVAYEMLTGAPPFVGDQVFDILTKQVQEVPAPLPSRRPNVPLWMEATVTRMLTKRPDDRFATMSRLVQALRMGLERGDVMDGDVARTSEAQPPASVSLAMERFAQNADGASGADHGANQQTLGSGAVGAATQIGRPTNVVSLSEPSPTPVEAAAQVDLTPQTAALPMQIVHENLSSPVVQVASVASSVDPHSVSNVWFSDPTQAEDHDHDNAPASRRRPKSRYDESSTSMEFDGRSRRKRGWLIGAAVLALGGGALAFTLLSNSSSDSSLGAAPVVAVVFDAAPAVATAVPDAKAVTPNPVVPVATPVASKPAIPTTPTVVNPVASSNKPKEGKDVRVPDPRSGGSSGRQPGRTAGPIDEEDPLLARRPGGKPPATTTSPAVPTPVGPAPGPSVSGSDQTLDPYNAPPATVITTNGDDQAPPPSAPQGSDSGPPPPAASSINAKAESSTLAFQGEQARDAGDVAAAASLFRKALTLNPRNLGAVMGLGQIASDQGQFEDSISHFRKATRIAPGSALAHTRLGEALLNSGNREGAAKAFERALKLDPDSARARDGYAEATQ